MTVHFGEQVARTNLQQAMILSKYLSLLKKKSQRLSDIAKPTNLGWIYMRLFLVNRDFVGLQYKQIICTVKEVEKWQSGSAGLGH